MEALEAQVKATHEVMYPDPYRSLRAAPGVAEFTALHAQAAKDEAPRGEWARKSEHDPWERYVVEGREVGYIDHRPKHDAAYYASIDCGRLRAWFADKAEAKWWVEQRSRRAGGG